MSGDDVVEAYPLFQEGSSGSIPTSPLQLTVYKCGESLFGELNRRWHSRLPRPGGFYVDGMFFSAEFNGRYYAVAGWSAPIARMLNNRNMLELRRFAISPEAPKNTASRVLSIMTRIISSSRPDIASLISYQDMDVHNGTIYKASGWKKVSETRDGDDGWVSRHGRPAESNQTISAKSRWQLDLKHGDY